LHSDYDIQPITRRFDGLLLNNHRKSNDTRLVFGGRQLQETGYVGDNDIKDGSLLHVLGRLRGGLGPEAANDGPPLPYLEVWEIDGWDESQKKRKALRECYDQIVQDGAVPDEDQTKFDGIPWTSLEIAVYSKS